MAGMAQVFGAAGAHSAQQSIAAFRKMFVVMFCVIGALCFGEGVLATVLLTRPASIMWWVFAAVFLALVCWVSRYAMQRVEEFDKERLSYRAGFLGEHEVAMELERLSEKFTIFNNVNTKRGNLDHVVVGPTGLFAIETKNWNGLISAASDGELMQNGKAATTPHVRKFIARSMMVREQAIALTNSDDFYVRAVMVFPKAHVDVLYGATGKVHCVRLNRLRDYIEDQNYSAKLNPSRVSELVRALQGIAGMGAEFSTTSTAAVSRSKSGPSVVATVVPNRT